MTSWRFNERPGGLSLPDFGLTPETQEELTERIWTRLTMGDDDVDDFVETETGEWEDLSDDQLRQAFNELHRARLLQQAEWADEQPRTNLDSAFEELTEAGIIARMNFTCCGTCGTAEIDEERDESRHWRGYVFFHQQDTETLVQEGYVYLNYGIFAPEGFDEEAYEKLSDEDKQAIYLADHKAVIEDDVVPRLARHGLDVEWDGNHRTRILLRNAQWYMPLA